MALAIYVSLYQKLAENQSTWFIRPLLMSEMSHMEHKCAARSAKVRAEHPRALIHAKESLYRPK
jgi:hypothetical protein